MKRILIILSIISLLGGGGIFILSLQNPAAEKVGRDGDFLRDEWGKFIIPECLPPRRGLPINENENLEYNKYLITIMVNDDTDKASLEESQNHPDNGNNELDVGHKLLAKLDKEEDEFLKAGYLADALRYFERAALKGSCEAQINLIQLYVSGKYEDNTLDELKYLLAKSMERNDPRAKYYMGLLFLYGIGVEQHQEIGLEWMRKAARQGHQMAMIYCLKYGRSQSPNSDYQISILKSAIEDDRNRADALYMLAMCHLQGNSTKKDPAKAVHLFQASAKAGLILNTALNYHILSQLELGKCYYQGIGAIEDKRKACMWFELAARNGNAPAQYYLGFCMREGEGISKDATQGFQWILKAARQNLPNAQLEAGLSYIKGIGVERNTEEGLKWIREVSKIDTRKYPQYKNHQFTAKRLLDENLME